MYLSAGQAAHELEDKYMLCNHCGTLMVDDSGNFGCPKCGNYVEVEVIPAKTVKLYKTNQTKAYRMDEQGEGFSLTPYSSNSPYYEGYDDGGKDYILPDGYSIGTLAGDEPAIFDDNNNYCILSIKYNSPILLSDKSAMLKKVR